MQWGPSISRQELQRRCEIGSSRSLISLAASWNIPSYFGTMNISDSSPPALRGPRVCLSSREHSPMQISTLADSFHSLVGRGTWRHNNGTWYENDVVCTNAKAHRSVKQIRCKHASFSGHMVKQYSIDALFSNGSSRTMIRQKKLFETNPEELVREDNNSWMVEFFDRRVSVDPQQKSIFIIMQKGAEARFIQRA